MKSIHLPHALAWAGFILAVVVQIPQIMRLIQRKSSQDLSLTTQSLCLVMILCAGAVVPLTGGSPLVLANYIVSFAAVALVLGLAVYYRIRPGGRPKPIHSGESHGKSRFQVRAKPTHH